MGAYYDLPAATGILKELYDGQLVPNEVYKKNPGFTMVPKKTNFKGKSRPLPLAYGIQTATSTFTNAQQNQNPIQYAEFLMTRKRAYALATIDNETMEATEDDKGAFVDALTENVDKAIQAVTLLLASTLFRAGTGSIGQVSTTTSISTGVITLQDTSAVVQFEVNQVLQANATDGGASPRSALGYVVAVNRQAGTVTVSSTGLGGAAGTPSGWTTSDYLLVQGNLNQTMSGFPAWLVNPSNVSASDNFYGVNRNADLWRLAGGYFDGSAGNMEEAFINGLGLMGREGGQPDTGFISFAGYQALEASLGSKVQYATLSAQNGDATIAFESIRVNGPYGPVNIIPDRNCAATQAYVLSMSNWTLRSLGELPKILTYKDSNQMLRVNNADAMELRVGCYFNLDCNAPGWSMQMKLPA